MPPGTPAPPQQTPLTSASSDADACTRFAAHPTLASPAAPQGGLGAQAHHQLQQGRRRGDQAEGHRRRPRQTDVGARLIAPQLLMRVLESDLSFHDCSGVERIHDLQQ